MNFEVNKGRFLELQFGNDTCVRKVDSLNDLIEEKLQNERESLSHFQLELLSVVQILLNDMNEYHKAWNSAVNEVGNAVRVTKIIEDILPSKEKKFELHLNRLCQLLYRYSIEFHLYFDGQNEHDTAYRFLSFCHANIHNFDETTRQRIYFMHFAIPIEKIKSVLNEDSIKKIRELESIQTKLEQERGEWAALLDENQSRAEKLEKSLKNYTSEFNFVGLSQGFTELSNAKKVSLKRLHIVRFILTIAIILTILVEGLLSTHYLSTNTPIDKLFYSFIPFFSLIFVFLYFYRVNLSDLKNIEAQLLQIELRRTLCRFIQSYVDYAKEAAKESSFSLDKFETLIFSGITMNPHDIPTTFDGIDQITGLFKSKG
ncbi:hypothetical protein K1B31_002745 [Vibrio vulnificus]|nr:hypothetical protein [Vibrio vulnificus]